MSLILWENIKKLYRPDRFNIFSESLIFSERSLSALNHHDPTFSCLNVRITINEKTRDSTSYSTLSLQGCYHQSSELYLCKETSSVKKLMVNYVPFKLFQKEMQRLVTPKTTYVPSSKVDHSSDAIQSWLKLCTSLSIDGGNHGDDVRAGRGTPFKNDRLVTSATLLPFLAPTCLLQFLSGLLPLLSAHGFNKVFKAISFKSISACKEKIRNQRSWSSFSSIANISAKLEKRCLQIDTKLQSPLRPDLHRLYIGVSNKGVCQFWAKSKIYLLQSAGCHRIQPWRGSIAHPMTSHCWQPCQVLAWYQVPATH